MLMLILLDAKRVGSTSTSDIIPRLLLVFFSDDGFKSDIKIIPKARTILFTFIFFG